MKRLALFATLLLSGCISTEMDSLTGHPIVDAQLRYGAPEQVIYGADGSRIYQFRFGGVAAIDKGCLLSFTARRHGDVWIIESRQMPRGLVC
jgi:hypothetical protein